MEKDENGNWYKQFDNVYIGEIIKWEITDNMVCADDIIDRVEIKARETCGESAEDWEAFDWTNLDEINELAHNIAYDIKFYKVNNITEYELGDKE